MPKLRLRDPEEIIYDEVLEYDGHTFYMVLPPSKELFREAIEMYDVTEELTEGYFRINPAQFNTAFGYIMAQSEYMQETGDQIEKVFDVLIGHLIVAWDLPEDDGGVWPCNVENKKLLVMVAKRKIVENIVERLRLWLTII